MLAVGVTGSEGDRLIARLVSNVCRRYVQAKEKVRLLERLGGVYLKDGVKRGEIAGKIVEKTGMSYTWVMKYLLDKFKDAMKSKNARATQRVTKGNSKSRAISIALEEPPKGVVAIKSYGNTNFVNVMLEKKFYKQLEERAEKLRITPDKLVYNAILLILKAFGQEKPSVTVPSLKQTL